jgi:uncharacterized protein with HEPN domain
VADILHAIDRCEEYRSHLAGPDEALAAMAYDAVLRNLAVIGEAVRALPEDMTASMPQIAWASIAGLRNVVVHEYFRVDRGLILDVLDHHLVPLAAALGERRAS